MSDYLQILQAVLPAILVIIGGIVTWRLKAKAEGLRAIEEKLRDERSKVYENLLEPYVTIMSKADARTKERAMKRILSAEYKKISLQVNLIGADPVIIAWNKLLEYTSSVEKSSDLNNTLVMRYFADFLLEVRRNLGNEKTTLKRADILRCFVSDVNDYEEQLNTI